MSPTAHARRLVCAVQFLTRLPTPRLRGFEPDLIARSALYFPLVGQGVGLLSALVYLIAAKLFAPLPAAILSVGAGVIATGGLHEDGLADAADGLFGGRDARERLRIMKDSRIGGFGALALLLVLGLKIALLAALSPFAGALALVVAHGLGRSGAVSLMAALPYAGDPERAKIGRPLREVRASEAAAAILIGVWPLLLLPPWRAVLALLAAALVVAGVGTCAKKRVGGVTGDVLGAGEQLVEAGVLMALCAGVRP